MLDEKCRIGCGLQRLGRPHDSSTSVHLIGLCSLARVACRVACGLSLVSGVLRELILPEGVNVLVQQSTKVLR